jgi:hypothetical protein
MIEFTLVAESDLERVRALIHELEDAVSQACFERTDELVDDLRLLLQGQPRARVDETTWQAIEQCLQRRLVDYVSDYLMPPTLASTLHECLVPAATPPALTTLIDRAFAQNLWVLQLPLDGEDPLEEAQRQ